MLSMSRVYLHLIQNLNPTNIYTAGLNRTAKKNWIFTYKDTMHILWYIMCTFAKLFIKDEYGNLILIVKNIYGGWKEDPLYHRNKCRALLKRVA